MWVPQFAVPCQHGYFPSWCSIRSQIPVYRGLAHTGHAGCLWNREAAVHSNSAACLGHCLSGAGGSPLCQPQTWVATSHSCLRSRRRSCSKTTGQARKRYNALLSVVRVSMLSSSATNSRMFDLECHDLVPQGQLRYDLNGPATIPSGYHWVGFTAAHGRGTLGPNSHWDGGAARAKPRTPAGRRKILRVAHLIHVAVQPPQDHPLDRLTPVLGQQPDWGLTYSYQRGGPTHGWQRLTFTTVAKQLPRNTVRAVVLPKGCVPRWEPLGRVPRLSLRSR